MSVLIKGMEMPHSCWECPFERCVLRALVDRHPDCPLVEVPTPHGRLIDADKLLKKGITLSWSVQKWVSEVDIGLMRTIIEAEEGEAHD